LRTGDAGYEQHRRVWNGMIDRRPSAIARCSSPADVRQAVKLARTEQVPVSVRGGGHNVAGTAVCEGGVMIDLSPMKNIRVDPAAREVIAGPGLLWGEFDAATQAHGLATTGGQVSHTGIAGLTLGGGLGYLMGKHGAACDNLLSVDVVTADGEMLTASADENADLFWAMRGAGGNFGIVTAFRYRVHPLGQVLGGMLIHPQERAVDLAAHFSEFLDGAPDELNTTFALLNSPEGMPLVGMIPVYSGDSLEEGARVLEPLRKFGPPVADLVQPVPYTAVQSMVDDAVPTGDRYYWRSNFVPALTPGLIQALREGVAAMPSPLSMILIFEVNGQIKRVPKNAMAFDHRDKNFEMSIIGRWKDPTEDAANMQWVRDVWAAVQPYVLAAGYVNHMTADETPDRVRAAYGTEKYERLSALKRKFDPENFFRSNLNIPPSQA